MQEEDLLLAQEEDLHLAQEQAEEWSPEKLKMLKKHFFPESSRDLWGVICYHHWYLRAGLEPIKEYLSKKLLRLKIMHMFVVESLQDVFSRTSFDDFLFSRKIVIL